MSVRVAPPVGSLRQNECACFTSPPAARACKDEAGKFCKDANDLTKPASVLACLR